MIEPSQGLIAPHAPSKRIVVLSICDPSLRWLTVPRLNRRGSLQRDCRKRARVEDRTPQNHQGRAATNMSRPALAAGRTDAVPARGEAGIPIAVQRANGGVRRSPSSSRPSRGVPNAISPSNVSDTPFRLLRRNGRTPVDQKRMRKARAASQRRAAPMDRSRTSASTYLPISIRKAGTCPRMRTTK